MKSLAALALLGSFTACQGEEARPCELVYGVDHERVRALGWAATEADDVEVVEAAAGMLGRRLPLFSPGKEARVLSRLDDGRIRVVFDDNAPLTDVEVERVSDAIESLGLFEMLVVPGEEQAAELGIDLHEERQKLEAWRAANPDAPLAVFNFVLSDVGGPDARLCWLERRQEDEEVEPAAVLLPVDFETTFGAAVVDKAYSMPGPYGSPALGFDLEPHVHTAFGDFTEDNVNRMFAMIIHETIVNAPRIDERLEGRGLIQARWKSEARVEMLAVSIRSGHGPLRRVR